MTKLDNLAKFYLSMFSIWRHYTCLSHRKLY